VGNHGVSSEPGEPAPRLYRMFGVFAVRRVFCAFGLKRRPINRRNANSANMTSQYFELFVYRN
jgi:hypothetical protein